MYITRFIFFAILFGIYVYHCNGYSHISCWSWKNCNVHYIHQLSEEKNESHNEKRKQPALLLLHGFGASSYHWRDNIDTLSQYYDVYALDLVGFGKSDKPIDMVYNLQLWDNQVISFIDEVIQGPTVVIGNSLGGCIALNINNHNLVYGTILLNAYGNFHTPSILPPVFLNISEHIIDLFLNWFIPPYLEYMQNDQHIQKLMTQLYPVVPQRVDKNLIHSIRSPLFDAHVPFVLKSMMKEFLLPKHVPKVVDRNKKPMHIIWGTKDPWIRQKMLKNIMKIYDRASVTCLEAGHCPHDELPHIVNQYILTFLDDCIQYEKNKSNY